MKSHRCASSPSPDSNLRSYCPTTALMEPPVSVHLRNSDVFVKFSVSVHFLFVEVTLPRPHVTGDAPLALGPRDGLEKWRRFETR